MGWKGKHAAISVTGREASIQRLEVAEVSSSEAAETGEGRASDSVTGRALGALLLGCIVRGLAGAKARLVWGLTLGRDASSRGGSRSEVVVVCLSPSLAGKVCSASSSGVSASARLMVGSQGGSFNAGAVSRSTVNAAGLRSMGARGATVCTTGP